MAGMKTLTPDQFRAELRKRIDATFGGSQARAAEVWKVDRGNLSNFLAGSIPKPFPKLLSALGYKWVLVRV